MTPSSLSLDCSSVVYIASSHTLGQIKIYNQLSTSRPEDATPETRRILEDISKHSGVCQRIQPAPRRVRVIMGTDQIRSIERVLMDLMYLDGKPVLHILDKGTHII